MPDIFMDKVLYKLQFIIILLWRGGSHEASAHLIHQTALRNLLSNQSISGLQYMLLFVKHMEQITRNYF